ncbi:MAG: hypothetical protein K0B06_04040 [Brevefilum sp.]|nr:hypothetical protein [Brevefilum sp.]
MTHRCDLIGGKRVLLTGVGNDDQGPIVIEFERKRITGEIVFDNFEDVGGRDRHWKTFL